MLLFIETVHDFERHNILGRGITMTKVYFVRHAHPDFSVQDDLTRPLSDRGQADVKKVTDFLISKDIHKVFSSPYKRAIDTVKDFAEKSNLEIHTVHDLRERKIDDVWIEDFNSFARQQWEDFEYKLSNGECLREVQERNIAALQEILKENKDKNIVIGTHGTALSTIINFYCESFKYDEFHRIKGFMPFVVCMEFEDVHYKNLEYTQLKDIEEFII